MQIRDGLAIGVVVERHAQLLQTRRRIAGDARRLAQRARLRGEAVTERARDRPGPEAAVQVAIDQDAGADVRAEIDVRLQARVRRDLSREVVVEVAHGHPRAEQRAQRRPVHVQRDVEHRARVTAGRRHPIEQRDVALDARHQHLAPVHRARSGQPQLLQRAQPVCVAVEHEKTIHASSPCVMRTIPRSCK